MIPEEEQNRIVLLGMTPSGAARELLSPNKGAGETEAVEYPDIEEFCPVVVRTVPLSNRREGKKRYSDSLDGANLCWWEDDGGVQDSHCPHEGIQSVYPDPYRDLFLEEIQQKKHGGRLWTATVICFYFIRF